MCVLSSIAWEKTHTKKHKPVLIPTAMHHELFIVIMIERIFTM